MKQNRLKKYVAALIGSFVLVFAGCGDNGTFEDAGEEVDEAIEDAGEEMEDWTD